MKQDGPIKTACAKPIAENEGRILLEAVRPELIIYIEL